MLIVISGPIASGKSAVARALARDLGRSGTAVAVIDLDLVYEMVADHVRKDDAAKWLRARRASAALADAFLADGVEVVIVEGEFLTPDDRRAFVDALHSEEEPRFVTLRTSFDVALRRVDADPTRTFSRDRAFLSRHYREAEGPLLELASTDLLLDTTSIDADEAAQRIAKSVYGS